MSLLSLRKVSKSYGATPAVVRADLEVPAGSRTAIVGPSGSGKTTLLRLIAGFETPDEGEITLGDTVLNAVPAHLRGIGYVAQEGALFPHLSVAANIGFGIERSAADRTARIEAMMDAVGLPRAMLTRRPHELSGGQQQRVALARALARQPRLMLLDEPFSALDAGLRDATRDMVAKVLGDAGVTAILVTHDQAEALSFADHLAVMRDGLVIQAGPPRDLYARPRDAETARFLGDAIILSAECADGWADCALGRLPIDQAQASGRASIMLRPEQVVLQSAETTGHAMGRVDSLSFRGSACRLEVSPLNGATWPSLTLYAASTAAPAAGDHVHLGLVGTAHVLE